MVLDEWISLSFLRFTFGASESWLTQSYFGHSAKEVISPFPTEIWIPEVQIQKTEIRTESTGTMRCIYMPRAAEDVRLNLNSVCYSTQVCSFVDSSNSEIQKLLSLKQ